MGAVTLSVDLSSGLSVGAGGVAVLASFAFVLLACTIPIALIAGIGALALAADRYLSTRAGVGPLVLGACPATATCVPARGSEAARQRELMALDRDLTPDEWLLVLQLLRDGVSADGVYHLLRLRHSCRGRRQSAPAAKDATSTSIRLLHHTGTPPAAAR